MANRLEPEGMNFRLPAEFAPSPPQRQYLQARLIRLGEFLRNATADEIDGEVARLFTALALENLTEASHEHLQEVYCQTLAGVPYVALARVCEGYRRGERGDRTWAPKPPALRQAILDDARKWQAERLSIRRVLEARILPRMDRPAEERAMLAEIEVQKFKRALAEKVLEMPERLRPSKGELVRAAPIDPEWGRDRANEWLARAQAEASSNPPPSLSLHLRERMGIGETGKHERKEAEL